MQDSQLGPNDVHYREVHCILSDRVTHKALQLSLQATLALCYGECVLKGHIYTHQRSRLGLRLVLSQVTLHTTPCRMIAEGCLQQTPSYGPSFLAPQVQMGVGVSVWVCHAGSMHGIRHTPS